MLDEAWKKEFEGKKVLIWGFGREGKSSYSFLRSVAPNAQISVAEAETCPNMKEIAALEGVQEVLSQDKIQADQYDLILKSPGIVFPEGFPKEHCTSQTELFLKHYAGQTIGVTGTKGKSTTSSLIAAALQTTYTVHLVGNIGIPCFDAIPSLKEEDLVVFEISCHQLERCSYSPHVGIFLNLYEEHLDHYKTMAAYQKAKEHIFTSQKENDIAIVQKDLLSVLPLCKSPILIGKDITATGKTLNVPKDSITVKHCRLLGQHNYLNAAIAFEVACKIYDVPKEQFEKAMEEFQPLPHRLQDCGEVGGIRVVDDSISTIGQSCIQALNTLPETDTVLIGGMDRGIDYSNLEDYLASRKDLHVVFMYGAGKRIYQELKEKKIQGNFVCCKDLEEAVQTGASFTRPHRILLLSPAAASYDAFKNFEERGRVFQSLVAKL